MKNSHVAQIGMRHRLCLCFCVFLSFGVLAACTSPVRPSFALYNATAGDEARKRGNYYEAIARYTQVLESEGVPTQLRAIVFHDRGVTYYYMKQFDQAIKDFDTAIQLKPDYADAYNNRGLANYYKSQSDRAIRDYSEAIRLKPDHANAYNNRGLMYYFMLELDKAIADFNEAIRLNPAHANAYKDRGSAYRAIGKYQEAISDLDMAISMRPDFTGAYFERGVNRFALGQFEAALGDFQKIQKYESSNVFGVIWLQLAMTRAGNRSTGARLDIRIDRTRWPGTVIALYFDETTPADVRASAAEGDSKTQYLQGCAADFYIGEFELQRKDLKKAQLHFRKAANACPSIFIEHSVAVAELKRIVPDPSDKSGGVDR